MAGINIGGGAVESREAEGGFHLPRWIPATAVVMVLGAVIGGTFGVGMTAGQIRNNTEDIAENRVAMAEDRRALADLKEAQAKLAQAQVRLETTVAISLEGINKSLAEIKDGLRGPAAGGGTRR